MKNDDFATAAYQRSEHPRPLRAKYYHGKKVIIIADATDEQLEALISTLFSKDTGNIAQ